MKTYSIYIGTRESHTYAYTGSAIQKGSLEEVQMLDLVGEKLSIDTFQPIVFDATNDLEVLLSRNQLVTYYIDNQLKGRWYIDEVETTNRNWFQLNCMSGIGLLDAKVHKGGLYGYGVTKNFGQVLAEILGGSLGALGSDDLYPITGGVFDCYVERWTSEVNIIGYLPYGNARDNLHSLMLAYSVVLTKDSDADIIFSYLYKDANAPVISAGVTYKGGSKIKNSKADRIEVTEHTYINGGSSDVEVILFDGSVSGIVSQATVSFDAPMHDLRISGSVTIHESGATYAIISGGGKLYGRPYTDSTVVVRMGTQTTREKVITVTDDCLINASNSNNVLNRLYEFYNKGRTCDVSFVYNGEQCGRRYTFTDNYGIQRTGYIDTLVKNGSGIIKAEAKIITDFTPAGQGDRYTTAVVLTGSGTWYVPSIVFEKSTPKIRVAIIGGGAGGQGGCNGTQAPTNTTSGFVLPVGSGGAGGTGGQGGNVLSVEVVLNGQTSFSYNCGTGGLNGGAGSAGTATTFGSYSSASGSPVAGGYTNIFTGDVYAKNGKDSVRGGNGGRPNFWAPGDGILPEDVTFEGVTHTAGLNCQVEYTVDSNYDKRDGGGGGGASADQNGSDWNYSHQSGWQYHGSGKGADSNDQPQASTYGSGGNASHGGGGGGVAGIWISRTSTTASWTYHTVYSAPAGTAGRGGQGGNGCVVIYY